MATQMTYTLLVYYFSFQIAFATTESHFSSSFSRLLLSLFRSQQTHLLLLASSSVRTFTCSQFWPAKALILPIKTEQKDWQFFFGPKVQFLFDLYTAKKGINIWSLCAPWSPTLSALQWLKDGAQNQEKSDVQTVTELWKFFWVSRRKIVSF